MFSMPQPRSRFNRVCSAIVTRDGLEASLALLLTATCVFTSGQALAARSEYNLKADAIFAEHSTNPTDPASERAILFAEMKYKIDRRWTIVASGQGWAEGVYAGRLDYPNELRNEDFQDARVQDGYAQIKTREFIARFGYQQVVWGETYGSYYADIINPKDLRYGIPADVSQARLGSPMAMVKYIKRHFSLQGLVIPQAAFNILPLPGSDFSPPIAKLTGFPTVIINRDKVRPFGQDTELGVRVSQTLGQFDLSAFYFNGYDRYPFYKIDPSTVLNKTLVVNEDHTRVNYAGAAVAADVGGYLVRAEFVDTQGRLVPILDKKALTAGKTDEIGYAVSVELPTYKRLNASVQFSEKRLSEDLFYVTTRQSTQYASLRALLSVFDSSSWETVFTYSTQDQGTRLQTELMVPLNAYVESHLGIENYAGPSESDFGRIQRASRVFAILRMRFHQ
jgi:hypothetical protein